jgi:hypothetical protein
MFVSFLYIQTCVYCSFLLWLLHHTHISRYWIQIISSAFVPLCLLLPTAFLVTCYSTGQCWCIPLPVPIGLNTLLSLSLTTDLEWGKTQTTTLLLLCPPENPRTWKLIHTPSTKPLVTNCRRKLTYFCIEVLHLGFWNLSKWHGTKTVFLYCKW